jgi:hypothetical protein
MTTLVNRREFLGRTAMVGAGLLPVAHVLRLWPAPAIHIALVGAQDATRHGAQLGVEEARHAAALFGGTVSLVPVGDASAVPTGTTAVLGNSEVAVCQALSSLATKNRFVFLNVACPADNLREANCGALMFHVTPSDAMLRDAAASAGGGEAAAWDPSLTRYGADTLNQRFVARVGLPMTSDAWTAWLAVKILWEASLRVRSSAPEAIAEYLRRDATQFDGHKGRALSFRPWNNQLRQPVYVKRGNTLVEAPVASGDLPSRDALDRLGADSSATRCVMGR